MKYELAAIVFALIAAPIGLAPCANDDAAREAGCLWFIFALAAVVLCIYGLVS